MSAEPRHESRPDPISHDPISHNPLNFIDPLGLFRLGESIHSPTTSATVVCDGKGGVRVEMLQKVSPCIADCIKVHEKEHVSQVNSEAPGLCKGQPNGAGIVYSSQTQHDIMERRAYMEELKCLRDKRDNCQNDKCKAEITERITYVRNQIAGFL